MRNTSKTCLLTDDHENITYQCQYLVFDSWKCISLKFPNSNAIDEFTNWMNSISLNILLLFNLCKLEWNIMIKTQIFNAYATNVESRLVCVFQPMLRNRIRSDFLVGSGRNRTFLVGSGPFGRIRSEPDLFGRIQSYPELFGRIRSEPDIFGRIQIWGYNLTNGPYIAERTQKAVYIVRCLWL
jgi:hypothetical protein